MTALVLAQEFGEQVSANAFLADVLYWVGTAATILAVVGLLMVELGSVRRRYALNTVSTRLSAGLIAAGAFLIAGNAVWIIQFNQAFGAPDPVAKAFREWWIAGDWMRTRAAEIDPAQLPNADLEQIFVAFFASFAALVVILALGGGLERLKASAAFTVAVVVGGVVLPVLLYLTWGPVSPLTVRGVHDFLGVFPGYILAGCWALVLAWRLGPRHRAADEDGVDGHNYPLVALGVGLLVVSVPLFAVACGFLIPDVGYFGINMSASGFGIVVLNCFAGIAGGAVGGAVVAFRTRAPLWMLLGPVAGYISVGALMDVAEPWMCLLLGFAGVVVALGVDRLMYRLNVDEHKIVPLGLGCGSFGVLAAGFVAWGEPVSGYPGLQGEFELHSSAITPGWQLLGLAVTLVVALGSALLVVLALERTVGIRIPADEDEVGSDAGYWGVKKAPSADGGSVATPVPQTPGLQA